MSAIAHTAPNNLLILMLLIKEDQYQSEIPERSVFSFLPREVLLDCVFGGEDLFWCRKLREVPSSSGVRLPDASQSFLLFIKPPKNRCVYAPAESSSWRDLSDVTVDILPTHWENTQPAGNNHHKLQGIEDCIFKNMC